MLLFGCDSDNFYQKEKFKSVELVSENKLKLDSITSNSPLVFEYIVFEKVEVIALRNQPDNSIKIYNFRSGDFIKNIFFPSEGPNNVGRVGQFHFYDMDSLLVSDFLPPFVTTINYRDSVYQRHLLVSVEQRRNRFSMPRIFAGHRLTVIDDYLFLPLPDNRPFSADKELGEETDNKVIMKYNFDTGSQEYFGNYPKNYPEPQSTIKGLDIFLSEDLSGEFLMASFPYQDSVIIFDLEGNIVRKVNMGYEFHQENNSFQKINTNDQFEIFKNEIKIPAYSSFLVDKINNKYLRVVETPIISLQDDELLEKYNNSYTRARRPFKILIFDEDFNYEGTAVFPNRNDEYEPYNLVVSRYGIILINRVKNNINEDFMHLDIFSIY